MKIKFRYQYYHVNFLDYIKIMLIKIRLTLKRQKRRFFRLANCLKTAIAVLPLWVIYWVVIYLFGKNYDQYDYFYQVIWESKNDLFSSVIIAASILLITNIRKFKHGFNIQHDLYVSTMNSFDDFFCNLITNIDNIQPIENSQWMFYTSERFNRIIAQIDYSNSLNFNNMETTIIDMEYYNIIELLDTIKYHIMNNSLGYCDRTKLLSDISELRTRLNAIRCIYLNKDVTIVAGYEIIKLAYCCMDIIHNLRIPWRKDIHLDKKIIELLEKYPQNPILDNVYISLLMDQNYDPDRWHKFAVCNL